MQPLHAKTNQPLRRGYAFAASLALGAAAAALAAGGALGQSLTIESWRNDDLSVWQDKIIPAFEAKNPGIDVTFSPYAPTEYNALLNSKLEAGTAGDLITCRTFDPALALYKQGHLEELQDLAAMKNFAPFARSGWTTDDGSATYCMPMAAVIHGFIYNKDAFRELGIKPPGTESEFFAMLDKIKADGSYVPLSMGTNDQWEAATMAYKNIGPAYWKGEEGRLAVINGTQKLTDEAWVAPYRSIAKWKPYLSDGFEAQTYPDSQNLFTLGRAAIYPSGSWEISGFNAQADFELGAFPPPVPAAGDKCYISDHVDMGLGVNTKSPNKDAAMTFIKWVGSAEFADIFSNELPGFFSLSKHKVNLRDPLAREFASWRGNCESTIRPFAQILSRGTPTLANASWGAAANVMRGTQTGEQVSAELQDGLASWYAPQQ